MEYNKLEVYGKLFTGGETYWVVSPHPEVLDNLWDELLHTAFFGVNTEVYKWDFVGELEYKQTLYPVPYAIVVSGTWHIELRPTVGEGTILCEKPVLLDQEADLEFAAEEEEVELIGDLVRSDDYRFINGEFDEEDWNEENEEDLEEVEIEEEALVEEG